VHEESQSDDDIDDIPDYELQKIKWRMLATLLAQLPEIDRLRLTLRLVRISFLTNFMRIFMNIE
tara:strand:- start:1555 stop:1746 length:192 start_codon:yes stop_codon:yes gene_type:complete